MDMLVTLPMEAIGQAIALTLAVVVPVSLLLLARSYVNMRWEAVCVGAALQRQSLERDIEDSAFHRKNQALLAEMLKEALPQLTAFLAGGRSAHHDNSSEDQIHVVGAEFAFPEVDDDSHSDASTIDLRPGEGDGAGSVQSAAST
jgi:hypothetical protein